MLVLVAQAQYQRVHATRARNRAVPQALALRLGNQVRKHSGTSLPAGGLAVLRAHARSLLAAGPASGASGARFAACLPLGGTRRLLGRLFRSLLRLAALRRLRLLVGRIRPRLRATIRCRRRRGRARPRRPPGWGRLAAGRPGALSPRHSSRGALHRGWREIQALHRLAIFPQRR